MLAALLAKIGLKDYLYAGLIAALLVAFGLFVHHERTIGAQRVVAADTKAVQVQAAKVAKVESDAQTSIDVAVQRYQAATASSPPPVPVLVCRTARSSGSVPDHAGPPGAGHGSSVVPSESTVPFDPAPGILKNDQQADAQVTLLQAYIRDCQAHGLCKK